MSATDQKLPYAVSEYIKENFREDFLFEVKEVRQQKGHWYYTVEVTKDDFIHTLKFNESGQVVKEETDPAFTPDIHEGPAFEDIPE